MWACCQHWRADLQPPAGHPHGSQYPVRTSTSEFCPSMGRGPQLKALGAPARDTPRLSHTDCPSGWADLHKSPQGELAIHVACFAVSCRFPFTILTLCQVTLVLALPRERISKRCTSIILRASAPATEWVRPDPGWPIKYHLSNRGQSENIPVCGPGRLRCNADIR